MGRIEVALEVRLRERVAEHRSSADTPGEIAAASDIIFTSLPTPREIEAVALGEDGIFDNIKPGAVYIDLSTGSPTLIREIHAKFAEKGAHVLDSPVSGGTIGARTGKLAIMVGGKQQIFDKNSDLMNVMGGNVVLTGDIGAGGVTKLANQIIVAANIEALSEALVLSQKAGVDPEKVFNAIRGGLAGSAVMEAKAPMMLSRNFQAGFRMRKGGQEDLPAAPDRCETNQGLG